MRHCSKCRQDVSDDDYGKQVYCRACWRTYDNARQKARRKAKRQAEIDSYSALTGKGEPCLTNNQKKRLTTFGRLCESDAGCKTCTLRERALCPASKEYTPILPPERPL